MASQKERREILDDLVTTGGGNIVEGGDSISVSGSRNVVNLSIYRNEQIVNFEQLRQNYLAYVISACEAVSFKGFPVTGDLRPEIPLESIYVPLFAHAEIPIGETWERGLQQTPIRDTIAIEDILVKQNRVVVLGDPGSGKTTLLRRLALQLAREDNSALPILIPLSAYAEALTRADRNLQQFLSDYFSGRLQSLTNLKPLFDLAIAEGKAFIFLDGLDECSREIRAHLASKIEAFADEITRYGNKVIVTSRIVGYREAPLDLQSWRLYTLLDWTQDQIKAFAAKWFLAFEIAFTGSTSEAELAANRYSQIFTSAINSSPYLENLASTPLMLTILCLLMRYKGALPLRRVELNEMYLQILISTWNRVRTLDNRLVGQPLDYFQTVSILGKLAFWLKNENPTSGIIAEEQLIEWLTRYYSGEDWRKPRGEAMVAAREFLNNVRDNSNVLIERGQGYFGFVHLTLEEHLAARGLIQLPIKKSVEFIESHLNDPVWQEVIVLAMGLWEMRGQSHVMREITREILSKGIEGIKLSGRILAELGEQGLGKNIASEIQEALNGIQENL